MNNRREFLSGVAGAAIVSALPTTSARAQVKTASSNQPKIKSITRRDETLLRLGGSGATRALTWTADDRMLAAIIEGAGWAGIAPGVYFTSALMSIKGEATTALIESVPGYPSQSAHEFFHLKGLPAYYGEGTLAVGERVYQFVRTQQGSLVPKGDYFTLQGRPSLKLMYSPDNGRTWHNQDGTTPVKRETPAEQSATTMVFWDDAKVAFRDLVLLQMGKAYEDNQDGYAYGYSGSGGLSSGEANGLRMFRVDKDRILDRSAYRFFAGRLADGNAQWVDKIEECRVVCNLREDWACTSVIHVKPLRLYLMAASKAQPTNDDDIFFKGPSTLGFWSAPTPWGPWTQVYEDVGWATGNPGGGCMAPVIAPKWIAPDGKSFWMAWTDAYTKPDFDLGLLRRLATLDNRDEFYQGTEQYRQAMPFYRFNVQRVDIELA